MATERFSEASGVARYASDTTTTTKAATNTAGKDQRQPECQPRPSPARHARISAGRAGHSEQRSDGKPPLRYQPLGRGIRAARNVAAAISAKATVSNASNDRRDDYQRSSCLTDRVEAALPQCCERSPDNACL